MIATREKIPSYKTHEHAIISTLSYMIDENTAKQSVENDTFMTGALRWSPFVLVQARRCNKSIGVGRLWQLNQEVIIMRAALPKLGRPVWVLLSGILFTHFSSYMLLPYFSIILSTEKGLSLGNVGLVLGAGSIAYLVGSLLGGLISDRLGPKRTMVGGLFIRGLGYLLFLWVGSFPALFAANLVAGIGDGLYMPPAKAGIATYSSQATKTTAFSYRGIAANIGVTVGPLLGTILLHRSSRALFLGVAVISFALAVEHGLLITKAPLLGQGESTPSTKTNLRDILRDKPFLLFSLVTVFVWALFTQFTLSLPLRAEQIHTARNIGLIWTTTSILIIVLQSPMTRLFTKYLHPLLAMGIGTVLMALALGSVALSSAFWHLIASAVLFTIGEMLFMPTSDAIVSDLAKPEQVGSYFGIASFVYGAGETLGNIGGGRLMETAVQQQTLNLPWLLFGGVGVVVGAAYFAMRAWRPLADPLSPVLQERTKNPHVLSMETTERGEFEAKSPLRKKQKT
jgi:MFS family permease